MSKFYDDDGGILPEGERLLSEIQNPAPLTPLSDSASHRRNQIADLIVERFRESLPSNYVARTGGPFYIRLFRALALQLADFQIIAELTADDASWSLTRPDFIYQMFGWSVFPRAGQGGRAAPQVDSDVSLRDFLRRMVLLLLEGAKKDPIERGVGLLSDLGVDIVEKAAHLSKDTSAWGLKNQYEFEVNMVALKEASSENGGHWHRIRVDGSGAGRTYGTYLGDASETPHHHLLENWIVQPYRDGQGVAHDHPAVQGFPSDPFTLKGNVDLILAALKPAHTVYSYRHLFVEMFEGVFTDESLVEISPYYYQDLRRNWRGARSITGLGDTSEGDRGILVDPLRDFLEVPYAAPLEIKDGANAGKYTVRGVHGLVSDSDPVARPYMTSPSGLSGKAVVVDGEVTDPAVDLSALAANEYITFLEGPNKGSYRVAAILGTGGGPPGDSPGPASRLRVAKSRLRLFPRMAHVVKGQAYEVEMDRLGMAEPVNAQEDVSNQFLI
jgi:hypothetical protein